MKSPYRQTGISTFNLLFYLLAGGLLLLCSLRIVPAYYDNEFLVKAGLEDLSQNPELQDMRATEIKSYMSKFFSLNGIRGEASRSLNVKRYKEGYLVNVNYEVRTNLFSNLDVVMSYRNQLNTNTLECCDELINVDELE